LELNFFISPLAESKLACALLNLILGSHFSLIEKFEEFMTAKDKPNVNHDQWSNLLEVLKLIGDDAEKYEDDGACKSAMHGSASVRNIEPLFLSYLVFRAGFD